MNDKEQKEPMKSPISIRCSLCGGFFKVDRDEYTRQGQIGHGKFGPEYSVDFLNKEAVLKGTVTVRIRVDSMDKDICQVCGAALAQKAAIAWKQEADKQRERVASIEEVTGNDD